MLRTSLLLALLFLVTTAAPLWCLRGAVSRTALASAWWWALIAAISWIVTVALAVFEPRSGDWTALGYLRLWAAVSALGPPIAVLGARWPGARAWNLIVLSLLVVFSLPIVEQSLLGRPLERDRVGLDGPRFAFYWVVASVGVLNYLPTRFAPAVLVWASGLAALTGSVGPWAVSSSSIGVLTAAGGLLVSTAAWLALALRRGVSPRGIEGAWLRLRDGWGAVWALRFRDRWNAAAEHYGWPFRLDWGGLATTATGTTQEQRDAAEQQFRLLLRRFADPESFLRN